MPRGIRAPVPTIERVEEAKLMEKEEPVAQQDGEGEPIVMGCIEYDFLLDEMSFFLFEIADIRREDREDMFLANQHMYRLKKRIDGLEKRFETQKGLLKAILDRLPSVAGALSSAPYGGQQ
jgi:hypothetical protein